MFFDPEKKIDLPVLAKELIEHGLMEKTFCEMTKEEVLLVCEIVFNASDPILPYTF